MSFKTYSLKSLGGSQKERLAATSALYSQGMKDIGIETADYIKRATDDATSTLEKLMSSKSFDEARDLQAAFTKSQWTNLVSQNKRFGILCHNMALMALGFEAKDCTPEQA